MILLLWVPPKFSPFYTVPPNPQPSQASMMSPTVPPTVGPRESHTHHSCLLCGKPRGQRGMDGSCEWSLGGKRPLPTLTGPQRASLPPCLAFPPAQPGPNCLPSSAQPYRSFSMRGGGQRKSTQQVQLLAHFSCGAWLHGGCSRPAPCTPTSHTEYILISI